MSFAEAILFIVAPQAEAWGVLGLIQKESKISSIGEITDELYLDHKRKY